MKVFIALMTLLATSLDQPYNKSISIQMLAKAYAENEFTADAQYKGKVFNLSGPIYQIEKEEGDIGIVKFETNTHEIGYIYCYLSDLRGLANYKVGNFINLRGEVDGRHGSHVVVKGCVIVR
jgi:hypothetical protein